MGWGNSRVLFFHGHQNDLEGPLNCRGSGGLLPGSQQFQRGAQEKKCLSHQFSGEW